MPNPMKPDEKLVTYINRERDSTFVHGKVHRRQYLLDQRIRWNPALTIHEDSYFNIREKIEPCMYIVERAMRAMEQVGMNPVEVPIRGGTDGARLSYMGLPCPNLCTGGHNYHGRFEYIAIEDMELCTALLVQILTNVE